MSKSYPAVTPDDAITMLWDASPYAVDVQTQLPVPLSNASTVTATPSDLILTNIHVANSAIMFTKAANSGTVGTKYTLSFTAVGTDGSVWADRTAILAVKASI